MPPRGPIHFLPSALRIRQTACDVPVEDFDDRSFPVKAMLMRGICKLAENPSPLSLETPPDPIPGEGEILIAVSACGVCHTELDEIEGRTPPPRLPVIPGHQVVGRVIASGPGAKIHSNGDRVGVAWIYSACGQCKFCLADTCRWS